MEKPDGATDEIIQHPNHRTSQNNELSELLSLNKSRTRYDYERLAKMSSSLNLAEHATSKKWCDSDVSEVNALLTEYNSLRQESMNSINNRTQILMIGIAAISALAGGTIVSEHLVANPFVVAAVFSGAIPLVCVFIFLVWLSEAIRSHRVGYYLASTVEARINAKLGRLAVSWEAGLWVGMMPRDELWGPSMMAVAIFGLFGAAAPWFGVIITNVDIGLTGRPLYEVVVPYSFYGLAVLYGFAHMKRLRNDPVLLSQMNTNAESKINGDA